MSFVAAFFLQRLGVLGLRVQVALVAVAGIVVSPRYAVEAAPIVEYTFSDGNASTATNTGTLGASMNGIITGGAITAVGRWHFHGRWVRFRVRPHG